MKRHWRKILVLVLVVWAISAAFSYISTSSIKLFASNSKEMERPKPFQLSYDDSTSTRNPKIRTESAIVVDLSDGKVLLRKNEDSVRSIASLTKLATAIVFVNTNPNLDSVVTVTKEDREGTGRSHTFVGEQIALHDLFHLMLICSDNVAARVVARSTGLDSAQFIEKMNELAISLNLSHTHYADPTGLDPGNVSTAAECAVIFKTALDKSQIREIIAKRDYSFKPVNGRRLYTIHNTNHMLFGRQDIIGGKTGYICEAGYCLALGFELSKGKELAAVLLGAPSSGCRFRDASRLLSSISSPKILPTRYKRN
jgi:serine-type D-Ala-D-Ala endopeptidase (penicillin-binding protein 7)